MNANTQFSALFDVEETEVDSEVQLSLQALQELEQDQQQ